MAGWSRVLFIPLTLTILLYSCRLTLVAPYDETIRKQIEETAKAVDRFYLLMLETTNESDQSRAYHNFVRDYINIQVEINDLLRKNRMRPLNDQSVRICEITLNLWIKYKEEHRKENTLSDGIIELNRMAFADLFEAMLVAEKAKKIATNPPE